MENREFDLDKYNKSEVRALPSAEKLRKELAATEGSDARCELRMLFDESSFVEIGAYTQRGFSDFVSSDKASEFEGVITGYGAIDGKLVFAFAEDASRMGGAVDERFAAKIANLYSLAIKNGAPVVGIFNSVGTDIFAGAGALGAYGRIISAVSAASGVIPQIAFVTGKCLGLSASLAAMFDITVKAEDASLYVSSPALTGVKDAQDAIVAFTGAREQCAGYIRSLISFLPVNLDMGVSVSSCADNLNRMLGELDFGGDARVVLSVLADNGVFYELCSEFANSVVTAFATIGGVKCGLVVSSSSVDEGRITAASARKISRFVNFCSAFSIPTVTLVDSMGLDIDKDNESNFFAPELAKLAAAYASSSAPKVTVIFGKAIGAAFVLLGSRSLGADIVYATDNSEICALSAESGVAFAWDKYITLEKTRDELVAEWKAEVSSPLRAAASGDVDDIISVNEMRARICSALLMLANKGKNSSAGHKILPL